VILGWIALRDEVWSDGFSVEEIERVERVTRRAALALRNIESFRRLEEERRLAALGTLSAGLAHEIRNPLAGLKGAAQVLQDVGLPDEGADMAEVILLETNRLDQVVTQFLDYARPFSLEDHLSAVDVRDVVRRVTPLVQASGLPDGVSLALDLGEVPAVRGDASRLTQVLLNLVQNALHAVGDAGTVTLRTRPSQLASRPAVDLSVHDDGRGVAPEHRAQLFTPFFTTRPEGTGLGLPICRRIVEAHGGELEVRHDVPGTTFIVRLPASGPSGDQ
jgi:two-component system sensor histidine kinase HydH